MTSTTTATTRWNTNNNNTRIVCGLLLLLLASFCDGASFDKPHGHRGLVAPFEPKVPDVKLDKNALKTLNDGKLYKSQTISETGSGRCIVVLDIEAPSDVVWSRILDYDNYSKVVSGCVASKNYNIVNYKPTKANNFLSQHIYTRMTIGLSLVRLEYFIKHSYYPKHNILTWTLDYDKKSDLDDSVGYWYLQTQPNPNNNNNKGMDVTRVYYSIDVSLPEWLPQFVKDFMSTKALTDATSWVKRYSEKDAKSSTSRDVVDGDTNISKKKKKKKGFWRCLQFWKKKDKKDDTTTISNNDNNEHDSTTSTTQRQLASATSKVSRPFVVFMIFTLILYNIGLFLDRISSI